MKTFLYAKIPLWIILILFFAVIILALAGFRITYAPELENSWSAISAVAAWVGVIASSIAIVVAIHIPKRIASNQNKIALFEKRFEFYDILRRCITFSTMIHNVQGANETKLFFATSFGDSVVKCEPKETYYEYTLSLMRHAISVLQKGKFLFPFETENEIKDLIAPLMCIIDEGIDKEHFWDYYSEFFDAIQNIEKNILPKVEMALSLTR